MDDRRGRPPQEKAEFVGCLTNYVKAKQGRGDGTEDIVFGRVKSGSVVSVGLALQSLVRRQVSDDGNLSP